MAAGRLREVWPVTEWSRTFAWVPRDTWQQGWVWLRPVWKRLVQNRDGQTSWQYATGPVRTLPLSKP